MGSERAAPTPAPDLGYALEIVLDIAADIGEGPIWDDGTNTLLFVDSTIGRIYRLDPATGALSTTDVGQEIGVAIPRAKGGLVISARDGLLALDPGGGDISLLVSVEPDRDYSRMNDAKCDSRGRLWSGTLPSTFERKISALYRIDPDLTLTRVVDEVSVSNGIAWSPDETRMYYVDTIARGVDVFDYDIATGAATNRRRFAAVNRADGLPDGITMDVEGCLWVALYHGGAVRRYAPDGRCLGQITLPVSRVTSCGFGGPDLTDLYITTAAYTAIDDGRPHQPHSGGLFRCRPGVAGLPTHHFAG